MSCQIIPVLFLILLTIIGVWCRYSIALFVCLAFNLASFGLAYYWDFIEPYDLKSVGSMITLGCCVFVFLHPISQMRFRTTKFVHPDSSRVKALSYVVILITVPASLFFMQYIGRIFAVDISALRLEGKMGGGTADAGLLHRYFMTCAYLYIIALALFVYSFICRCISRFTSALLLVGSLSYPLSGIFSYSRQMTIMYAVSAFTMVFLAIPFCHEKLRRGLIRGMLIVAIICLVPMSYITIERFSGNERQGFYEYLGGGPRFFSRVYYHGDNWEKNPSLVFLRPYSLFWNWFEGKGTNLDHDLSIYEANKALTYEVEDIDQPSAPFVSFCGTWLSEFPLWVVIVVHVGLFAFGHFYFRYCSHRLSIAGLTVCALYFTSGIMYPIGYLYVGTPGNSSMALIGVMALALGNKRKNLCRSSLC